MKRHSYKPSSRIQLHSSEAIQQVSPSLNWSIKPKRTSSQQKYQANIWVQLLELPSPFSYGEGLLLCQHSDNKWVAWIPNYGEAILHTSQFCLAK